MMPETENQNAAAESKMKWYALQTMARHEKKVYTELQTKEFECYLPTVSKLHQWSDRKKRVVEPLFAGYVFVRTLFDSPERPRLLRTNGIVGFVGVRGIGVPIPDSEIDAIQAVMNSRLPARSEPFVSIGQRVRIRGGALDGVEGLLQDIKGDQSLVISIALIQRSLAVTVSGFSVEPISSSEDLTPVLTNA